MTHVAPCRVSSRAGGPRVLVVDADREASAAVAAWLAAEGFAVDVVRDAAAPAVSDPVGYDLVLLDPALPGRSGLDVLRAIRSRLAVPVLLLSARDSEADRVIGLELGADDFVPKPPRPRELAARIRAVLRRCAGAPGGAASAGLSVGDVRLEPACRLAWRGRRRLDLTTAEFNALEHLLRRAGQPVGRDALARAAYGHPRAACGRGVDNIVSKLRRKLGPDDPIRTLRGTGYLYAVAAGGAE